MTQLNPDFRSADEVEIPRGNLRNLCGWSNEFGEDRAETEKRMLEGIVAESPAAFQQRVARDPDPGMFEKWTEFQESKGRANGSADLSLLDEFVTGAPLLWLAQIIGSCVCSNSFRPWVARMMWQIGLLGDAMDYLGREEFGVNNYSFYGPFQYGLARRKANMKRGDGLYEAPFTWSLMQGVIPCNHPELTKVLRGTSSRNDRDFPEPQGNAGKNLYRAFGAHQYIEQLTPFVEFPMAESPAPRDVDHLMSLASDGKPAFVCSMVAIHKVGTHKDGFAIHKRNRRDQWAHNMSFQGFFIASDGDVFIRLSNESWGKNHIYNVPVDEVASWFKANMLTVRAIGEIAGPESVPPAIL